MSFLVSLCTWTLLYFKSPRASKQKGIIIGSFSNIVVDKVLLYYSEVDSHLPRQRWVSQLFTPELKINDVQGSFTQRSMISS